MHPDLKAVRDKLFAGATIAREPVTLANGVVVDALGMSVDMRGGILMRCMSPTDKLDEDDKPIEELDMAKLTPFLVIEGTRFTGTDEPVFTEADRDAIGKMDASYLDPIVNTLMRLSGLGKKAMEIAKGNSDATPA